MVDKVSQLIETVEEEVPEDLVDKTPDRTDPKWTEYVMSLFEDNELDNGYPKLDGLRRVAEVLYDIPLENSVAIQQCPNRDNEFMATCICKMVYEDDLGNTKIYQDVGHAHKSNIKGVMFQNHLVSIASSRAEARVLRKVLGLKIYTTDELSQTTPAEQAANCINEGQLHMIHIITQRKNVDAIKLLTKFAGECKVVNYKLIPEDRASDIFTLLNGYNGVDDVPEDIRGFKSNWRSE